MGTYPNTEEGIRRFRSDFDLTRRLFGWSGVKVNKFGQPRRFRSFKMFRGGVRTVGSNSTLSEGSKSFDGYYGDRN